MEKIDNSIGERLSKLYRIDSRSSIIALSNRFDVAETTVRRWLKDELGMSMNHLVTILEDYPNLNVQWFLTGNGSMFNQEKENFTQSSDIISKGISLKDDVDSLFKEYESAVHRLDALESKMREYESAFNALNTLLNKN